MAMGMQPCKIQASLKSFSGDDSDDGKIKDARYFSLKIDILITSGSHNPL